MYRVCVACDDPLTRVSRIIDVLRRMGAGLTAMDLMQVGDDDFEVAIDYSFEDPARVETFVERLHLIPGVEVLDSCGFGRPVSAAQCSSYAAG